jgi:hypothetical protein
MNNMEEVVEVLAFQAGSPYAKKVRCRLCGDIIFEVQDKSPKSETNAEMARLTAHLSLQHKIEVNYRRCSDPNCLD